MDYHPPCVVRIRSHAGHQDDVRGKVVNSMSGVIIEEKQGLVISHGSLLHPVLKTHPEIAKDLRTKGFSQLQPNNISVDILLQREKNIKASNNFISYQVGSNVPAKNYYTELLNCSTNDSTRIDLTQVFQAHALFVFESRKFKQSFESLLPVDSGWTFKDEDTSDTDSSKSFNSNQSMDLLMTCFVVIGLNHWHRVGKASVSLATIVDSDCHIGDTLEIIATPFGDLTPEVFMNSHSRGVISNVSGPEDILILTDARCIPGSEGGPVFTLNENDNRQLLGIVVSPLCWKNNEWIGLAIVCDIREIIKQTNRILALLYPSIMPISMTNKPQWRVKLKSSWLTVSRALCLVRSGSTWGSGVLVNSHLGIILTCSHVVRWGVNSTVLVKFASSCKWYRVNIVHCTPQGDQFDIAVLKIAQQLPDGFNSLAISSQPYKQGDAVRVIGHALFDDDSELPPSITSGVISKIKRVDKIPVLMQTTCAVHAGASGGAVVSSTGQLLGMVVCNAKDVSSGASFPHINLSVPLQTVSSLLSKYECTNDQNVLKALHIRNKEVQKLWNLGYTEPKIEKDLSKRVESKL